MPAADAAQRHGFNDALYGPFYDLPGLGTVVRPGRAVAEPVAQVDPHVQGRTFAHDLQRQDAAQFFGLALPQKPLSLAYCRPLPK